MTKRFQILLLAGLFGALVAYVLFGFIDSNHAGGQDGVDRGTTVTAEPAPPDTTCTSEGACLIPPLTVERTEPDVHAAPHSEAVPYTPTYTG